VPVMIASPAEERWTSGAKHQVKEIKDTASPL
jgi:hypothetical protein